MAEINEQAVSEIKTWLSFGRYEQKRIAEVYGVSQQTVCDIKKGRRWRHVWSQV